MIRSIIQLLIILLIGSKNEPVNDLRRREPRNFKGLNWTFIFITLAMVLVFMLLLVAMVYGFSGTESGMSYNHFMNNI